MTIVEIQKALALLGFDPGPADGDAGPRTIAAVRAFQRKYALKADGNAGPVTQRALRQALSGLNVAPAPEGRITLDARSERSLVGVHPHLDRVVRRAAGITRVPFIVTEGLRTIERQRSLVASGASRTMKSRHLTGHAIDLAAKIDGTIRWDWPLYQQLALAMKQAAAAEGVPLEWGGDWRSFKDGPHFQLPWAFYPA